MRRVRKAFGLLAVIALVMVPAMPGMAAATQTEIVDKCEDLFGDAFGAPNSEPLAICQWDMAIIGAGTESFVNATGEGVSVGIIDTGVDFNHPDIAPNLDVGKIVLVHIRRHTNRRSRRDRQW